jgi:hypothetical protein
MSRTTVGFNVQVQSTEDLIALQQRIERLHGTIAMFQRQMAAGSGVYSRSHMALERLGRQTELLSQKKRVLAAGATEAGRVYKKFSSDVDSLNRQLGLADRTQAMWDSKLRTGNTTAARHGEAAKALEAQMARLRKEIVLRTDVAEDMVRTDVTASASTQRLAASLGSTTQTMLKAKAATGRMFLELSRGVEDFAVAGPIGALNNIPTLFYNMAQSMGMPAASIAGLVAKVSGLGTAIYVLYKQWGNLRALADQFVVGSEGAFNPLASGAERAENEIAEVGKRIEELKKQANLSNFTWFPWQESDLREAERLDSRMQQLEAEKKKRDEIKALADAAADASKETDLGDRLIKSFEGLTPKDAAADMTALAGALEKVYLASGKGQESLKSAQETLGSIYAGDRSALEQVIALAEKHDFAGNLDKGVISRLKEIAGAKAKEANDEARKEQLQIYTTLFGDATDEFMRNNAEAISDAMARGEDIQKMVEGRLNFQTGHKSEANAAAKEAFDATVKKLVTDFSDQWESEARAGGEKAVKEAEDDLVRARGAGQALGPIIERIVRSNVEGIDRMGKEALAIYIDGLVKAAEKDADKELIERAKKLMQEKIAKAMSSVSETINTVYAEEITDGLRDGLLDADSISAGIEELVDKVAPGLEKGSKEYVEAVEEMTAKFVEANTRAIEQVREAYKLTEDEAKLFLKKKDQLEDEIRNKDEAMFRLEGLAKTMIIAQGGQRGLAQAGPEGVRSMAEQLFGNFQSMGLRAGQIGGKGGIAASLNTVGGMRNAGNIVGGLMQGGMNEQEAWARLPSIIQQTQGGQQGVQQSMMQVLNAFWRGQRAMANQVLTMDNELRSAYGEANALGQFFERRNAMRSQQQRGGRR